MGHFRNIHIDGLLALLVVTVVSVVGCSYYNGPVTDHFGGSRFYNKEPDKTFFDHLKWMWEMETIEWPEWIEDPTQPPPIENVKEGEFRITYINHATVLIKWMG